MLDKLEKIQERYRELNELLSDPDVFNDMDQYLLLSKEQKQVEEIVRLSEKYLKMLREIEGAGKIIEEETDKEMLEIATNEIKELEAEKEKLEEEIKILLVPRDPEDEKNVILEIRAGTGGDEACLFAGDLYKMYMKYAEQQGWKTELLSSHPQEIGGFKEIIFLVKGDGAYGKLKFEAGVHRVQRVPATETSGRIHTSAASVAVLPEAEDVDIDIDQKDLKIDVYRSSGPGGQSVNTTDSAVRITHIPTGMVVTCQDEKSQHKNRAKALKVLQARLFERKLKEEREKEAATRRSMVSTGDRSAKIRTFNFPQGRVTDHRISLTLYKLDEVIAGNLDEFIEHLQLAERTEKLEKS
ncbi:MAG: peptide chain release factor 1 [candidate division KSB1 bacterium]|jgi:peptide chain release factor 1|nr:peptide chain release factor 1 [candidate division KSB1 bacterium]